LMCHAADTAPGWRSKVAKLVDTSSPS
jgi:hypothetical protein